MEVGEMRKEFFCHALSQFITGVAIITLRTADNQYTGLTINSFNSVSLEPPLILWSLNRDSKNLYFFLNCSHYVVNVLSANQLTLAKQFALKGNNKFNGVDFQLSSQQVPVLTDNIAWFECKNKNHYIEGDHIIFIGKVEHCEVNPKKPLVFFSGVLSNQIKTPVNSLYCNSLLRKNKVYETS